MSTKKHSLLFGGHMSIAGGFQTAIQQGESLHCSAIQIFTKSNRQWKAKPIDSEEAASFKQAFAHSSLTSIVAHATYLINMASADSKIIQQSKHALVDELQRCHQLGIPYLILHPGASIKGTAQGGIERLTHNMDEVLEEAPGDTVILLENMAGQGSVLASTFEQLASIYDALHHKKRVGIAFDTCHAFAAGYDFSTPASYKTMWDQFDTIVGISLLKAMHINDSLKGLGSHVDRHAHIGKGKIGIEAFELLFNDPRFFDIPKILETPWEKITDYIPDMNTIRELLSSQTRKKLGYEGKESE